MSINPIFLVVASVCVVAFLSSILGRKTTALIVFAVVLFGLILAESF